ncbi:hypothetical protein PWT90_03169 [Aphanocladium album]|nr:hypothetical protein PWT90_03169 [Aphanocladium album]
MSPSKLPANIAASAETSRLQAELLQLHLLHRDAAAVEAQWTSSAKSKLGPRFRDVRDAHRALAVREADELEGDNVAALQSWSASGNGGGQLDDKIQALDAAVSGVWAMSEPGGKYARVVRRFERWIERVMDLEEARANGTVGLLVTSGGRTSIGFGSSTRSGGSGGRGGVEEALFIQDLEQAWTEDCAGMTRKLETWQDQLDGAGELYYSDGAGAGERAGGRSTTSLARMLDGVRSLVEDMLSELGAMEEIRQAALVREEDWIEAMNRDDDENDTPRAGAVWRAM